MNKCENTCSGCLWADSCGSNSRCGDYTSIGDEQDVAYYESVLVENERVYSSLVAEFDS